MLTFVLIVVVLAIAAYVFRNQLLPLIRRVFGTLEMPIRDSFHLWSQRLNSFVTLVLLPYIIASNGGFIGEAIQWLPEAYRIIAAPFVGFVAFLIVSWARLRIQHPKP